MDVRFWKGRLVAACLMDWRGEGVLEVGRAVGKVVVQVSSRGLAQLSSHQEEGRAREVWEDGVAVRRRELEEGLRVEGGASDPLL